MELRRQKPVFGLFIDLSFTAELFQSVIELFFPYSFLLCFLGQSLHRNGLPFCVGDFTDDIFDLLFVLSATFRRKIST